jgi:hypothetical protein
VARFNCCNNADISTFEFHFRISFSKCLPWNFIYHRISFSKFCYPHFMIPFHNSFEETLRHFWRHGPLSSTVYIRKYSSHKRLTCDTRSRSKPSFVPSTTHNETKWNKMKQNETTWNKMKQNEMKLKQNETINGSPATLGRGWNRPPPRRPHTMKQNETKWNEMKRNWNKNKTKCNLKWLTCNTRSRSKPSPAASTTHNETKWNKMKQNETKWNKMKQNETKLKQKWNKMYH